MTHAPTFVPNTRFTAEPHEHQWIVRECPVGGLLDGFAVFWGSEERARAVAAALEQLWEAGEGDGGEVVPAPVAPPGWRIEPWADRWVVVRTEGGGDPEGVPLFWGSAAECEAVVGALAQLLEGAGGDEGEEGPLD